MSDVAIRIAAAAAVLVASVLIGRLAARGAPRHPPIALDRVGAPPGVAVFTSTDCGSCKEALAIVRDTGVPLREYTFELEAARFAEVGVHAVPLVVIVDRSGSATEMLAGVPRPRTLRRALGRAGW